MVTAVSSSTNLTSIRVYACVVFLCGKQRNSVIMRRALNHQADFASNTMDMCRVVNESAVTFHTFSNLQIFYYTVHYKTVMIQTVSCKVDGSQKNVKNKIRLHFLKQHGCLTNMESSRDLLQFALSL